MTRVRWAVSLLAIAVTTPPPATAQPHERPEGAIRFATFNASLNRESPGGLVADLATPDNAQARNVAEIIQRVRPDILLVNEFDHDPEGRAAELFQTNYLGVAQRGARPITYPHRFTAMVNTGVASGQDLNGDGRVDATPGSRGYANDALGYGLFPGQYGMVLFSMFPIDRARVRTFERLLWKDVPGALLPAKADGQPFYGEESLAVLRLSSKSHWDVPIQIGDKVIHILASHPTPPAFDGPEDRNGRRNFDEIRLWADYASGPPKSDYLHKDAPEGAPTTPPETFVIMGDLNADPEDGGSVPGAIQQLLNHPRVNPFTPTSAGAAAASASQGGKNAEHKGDPAADTADFADAQVGNLRVDYVLPSRDLKVLGGGVFWPEPGDTHARLVGMGPPASSDHRLVYLDARRP